MAEGAEMPVGKVVLRNESGNVLALSGQRWVNRADAADVSVLDWAIGPVLDLGCGPGRHAEALAERGHVVLGVDLSKHAVSRARRRHIAVLERSVFDAIPKAGEWGSALLLDGNIGMGGNPTRLLERVGSLVRTKGRILVEVTTKEPHPFSERVCLELDGIAGPWFMWAHVTATSLRATAKDVGFVVDEEWETDERHFTVLSNEQSRLGA